MLKQKFKNLNKVSKLVAIVAASVLLIAAVPTRGFGVFAVSCGSVFDCQQQINNLNDQNNQAQVSLNNLEAQAGSYQAAITVLDAQIVGLNQQIANNVAQQDQAQAELVQEKTTLGDSIKAMYLESDVSTLEILASSKNLSQYVDRQQYRNAVTDKVKATVDKINALKIQLTQLHTSLVDQQAQVAAAQAEQNRLLTMNESQQNQFNQQIQDNQGQISQLRKQQAALIQAGTRAVVPPPSGGSGGACDAGYGNGNYPMAWCDAWQDSVATTGGFPNRECTSYAYWYFTQVEGYSDFSVTGDAKYWAANSSYPTQGTPVRGAIAVETSGTWGHVAIVQGLPGDSYWGGTVPDGYILVSEMNYDYGGHFRYSFSPLDKFSTYIVP